MTKAMAPNLAREVRRFTNWRAWLRGLLKAGIEGGSTAALATLGSIGTEALGVAGVLDAKQALTVGLSGALVSMLVFLKSQPLPEEDVRTKPPFGPNIVGMLVLTGVLAAAATVMPGCATVKNATPQQVDTVAAVTQIAVSNIVMPVLANNPKYEPALLAVAVGVDAVFAAGEVTPHGVNAFLDALAVKHELDAKTRLYIGSGILDLLDLYKQTYGVEIARTTDPRLVTMLNAFRDGIRTGVQRYHALRP